MAVSSEKISSHYIPTWSSLTQEDIKWCQPTIGELKVNVDASVYEGEDSFSIGMVMRNHQGHYVKGKIMRFGECVSVMEADLVGTAETLKWIEEVPTAT